MSRKIMFYSIKFNFNRFLILIEISLAKKESCKNKGNNLRLLN